MIARLDWRGTDIEIDFSRPQPIALPLDPRGDHPSFFSPGAASAEPLAAGEFVGEVGAGGSCNADVLRLVPHCHGTHSECIGHLTTERQSVQDVVYDEPALALLLSLTPRGEAGDPHPEYSEPDLLEAMARHAGPPAEALIIRQWPPADDLARRDYALTPGYPVLSKDAMEALADLPLKHLLLDAPSLDRADDTRLVNHRRWWGLEGPPTPSDVDPARRSVTEMVYAPPELQDGWWWLQPGLSPIVGDATPSRPVLFPVGLTS